MNNIINLLLVGISNTALSVTNLPLVQCCHGAIYQPSVDTDLKERTFRLTEEKSSRRRQDGGKVI